MRPNLAPLLLAIAIGTLALLPGSTTEAEPGAAAFPRPGTVQRLVFSARKYTNVRRHFRGAVRRGWPRRLVLNRRGADERRERLLRDVPARDASTATSTRRRWAGARSRAGARA